VSSERKQLLIAPDQKWFVWIFSNYVDFSSSTRSVVGELIRQSKYQGSVAAAHELEEMVRIEASSLRTSEDPSGGFSSVTSVISVPSFQRKLLDLPRRIAAAISMELGVPDLSDSVKKVKDTGSAKHEPAESESLLDPTAYQVNRDMAGQTVLIVDDVFRTGKTLESVAIQLRAANARVTGFCLAKAVTGMGER